jgi:hypothetical protein
MEGWTLVPNVGTYVEANHPITVLNPTKAFRVDYVRCDSGGRWAVRGACTCWFGINSVRPASEENAVAAEMADATP